MTLNDYREQFGRNRTIMSRTASGSPETTDRAIGFLYYNRGRNFRSAGELEELVLEAAALTNSTIAGEGSLFRSGKDSADGNYAGAKDIPAMWARFMTLFHWMLVSQCFDVEEIAAFSEYIIHILAHFFQDNCGKIAMLISTYVFMRFDLPCPVYTSEEEYYRAAARRKRPTVRDLQQILADPGFWDFVSYYLTICPSRDISTNNYVEKLNDGSIVCHLTGNLTGVRSRVFRQNIESFYEKYGDVLVVFDCSALAWIDMEGINVLTELKAAERWFALKNLNADCMVLFKVEGFEEYLEGGNRLPKIDLSSCEKINEGVDGIIYRVSDEVVAKTFKEDPDYYDIVRRRIAQKNALIAGVPAPFSFGYAEYDGGIVTLMELIHSKSLLQMIWSEENYDGYIIRYAQFVRQLHEIRDEEKLQFFEKNLLSEEILAKADRCDRVLRKECRGRARELIEALDEPECLVHGDIHPKNIMVSGDEMLFIDFDSFSTGKGIYDLGTIYRALLCCEDKGVSNYNSFLKLPADECRRIWDLFIGEYYKGEPEETVREKAAQAGLIGTVITLARLIRTEAARELISEWALELEVAIDGL